MWSSLHLPILTMPSSAYLRIVTRKGILFRVSPNAKCGLATVSKASPEVHLKWNYKGKTRLCVVSSVLWHRPSNKVCALEHCHQDWLDSPWFFSLGFKIIYINTLGRCDQRMLPSVSAVMCKHCRFSSILKWNGEPKILKCWKDKMANLREKKSNL